MNFVSREAAGAKRSWAASRRTMSCRGHGEDCKTWHNSVSTEQKHVIVVDHSNVEAVAMARVLWMRCRRNQDLTKISQGRALQLVPVDVPELPKSIECVVLLCS